MYYLYLKTHNVTGLNYLGYTSKDPFKYKGSGIRWTNHIKKHGSDVTTVILYVTQYKEEITDWGIYYSDLWNIVKSPNYANLMKEAGDNIIISKETKLKMSITKTGTKRTPFSDSHKKNLMYNRRESLKNNKGQHPWKGNKLKDIMNESDYKKFTNNLSVKCGKYGEDNGFFGKVHNDKTKKAISDTKTNVYILDEKIIAFGFENKRKASLQFNTTTERILCKKNEFINSDKLTIYTPNN